MESQRLGYRLDASAMSGRLRKRADIPAVQCGYSKRCQRDLDRFYNKALKDVDNHFSTSFQFDSTNQHSHHPPPAPHHPIKTTSSSFTVLKTLPLPVADIKPLALKPPRVRKQKSLSYAKIRHSCNEILHLSIDCQSASGEDNDTLLSSGRRTTSTINATPKSTRLRRRTSAEKRVKFKKSSRTNSESGENPSHKDNDDETTTTHRANYLMQRVHSATEKRDKEYLNELFCSKTGEIERDVQGFVKLNYTLVAKYLTYENSSYKHKLLQALRWRLNLNEKLTQRTIQDFVRCDILRIKQNLYYEKSQLETLLWPSRNSTTTANANYIQNSMARLLNGLVSFEEGRNYIGNTSIVNHLIWGGENELFKIEPSRQFIDNSTAGMLVAALMKLSTVPWQRRDMLNKNLLGWILGHLEDIEYSGTVIQTKYSLALLNSLLKLPEAVEELTRRAGQVLVLMARYLKREKAADWFFTVKSILVKLFKHSSFRQAAKQMNFETLLRKLINPLDFKSKKEIEFMILYLNDSGNITQLPCSASPFEVEEKILFDSEIDAEDPIVNLPGLDGEVLLEEQFAKYRVVYQEQVKDAGEKEMRNSEEIPIRNEIPISEEDKLIQEINKIQEVIERSRGSISIPNVSICPEYQWKEEDEWKKRSLTRENSLRDNPIGILELDKGLINSGTKDISRLNQPDNTRRSGLEPNVAQKIPIIPLQSQKNPLENSSSSNLPEIGFKEELIRSVLPTKAPNDPYLSNGDTIDPAVPIIEGQGSLKPPTEEIITKGIPSVAAFLPIDGQLKALKLTEDGNSAKGHDDDDNDVVIGRFGDEEAMGIEPNLQQNRDNLLLEEHLLPKSDDIVMIPATESETSPGPSKKRQQHLPVPAKINFPDSLSFTSCSSLEEQEPAIWTSFPLKKGVYK